MKSVKIDSNWMVRLQKARQTFAQELTSLILLTNLALALMLFIFGVFGWQLIDSTKSLLTRLTRLSTDFSTKFATGLHVSAFASKPTLRKH